MIINKKISPKKVADSKLDQLTKELKLWLTDDLSEVNLRKHKVRSFLQDYSRRFERKRKNDHWARLTHINIYRLKCESEILNSNFSEYETEVPEVAKKSLRQKMNRLESWALDDDRYNYTPLANAVDDVLEFYGYQSISKMLYYYLTQDKDAGMSYGDLVEGTGIDRTTIFKFLNEWQPDHLDMSRYLRIPICLKIFVYFDIPVLEKIE